LENTAFFKVDILSFFLSFYFVKQCYSGCV
jgi:hypothetical protein